MAKTIIHVNQHVIRSNNRLEKKDPVITCKSNGSNEYAHEAIIYDKDGREAARIVYRPDRPLNCGAKVWIETQNKVELIEK